VALFPKVALLDLEGRRSPISEAFSSTLTLVLLGHGDCKTTRETLPYVDRIHRLRARGTSALAVLQDGVEAARELTRELGIGLPVRLEEEPYPVASQLNLTTVPTLMLLDSDTSITRVSEGFSRADLEDFAERLGVKPPLFGPADHAPSFRPG